MGFDIPALIGEMVAGKPLVHGFDFLKDDDIGIRTGQPNGQRLDPRLDAIDVEACDFHARIFSSGTVIGNRRNAPLGCQKERSPR